MISYFSVGPIPGFKTVHDPETGNDYVSQRAPARDYRRPQEELGICRVVSNADSFWGGENSKPYRGRVLCNPTWRAIRGEHDRQMRKTNDYHHVFLEGIRIRGREQGVTIIELCLGS